MRNFQEYVALHTFETEWYCHFYIFAITEHVRDVTEQ